MLKHRGDLSAEEYEMGLWPAPSAKLGSVASTL